jgi:hypothetical protein
MPRSDIHTWNSGTDTAGFFRGHEEESPGEGGQSLRMHKNPQLPLVKVMIANSLPAEEFHTLKHNVSQVLRARALFREKGHLLPESLRKDQNKLMR